MTKKTPRATDSAPDGDALFEAAMRDIRPLSGKRRNAAPSMAEVKVPPTPRPAEAAPPPPPPMRPQPDAAVPTPAGLDRRSQERLRRGRLKIEGRLDLHGHTQADAHRALTEFVHRAYGRGLRCILVITGKGGEHNRDDDSIMPHRGKGVLRRQVPLWLGGELGRMVLAVESARPQHGGDGAFYVLLRRHRNV